MRRSSARLRDLAITVAVAVSLVLVPSAQEAAADHECRSPGGAPWVVRGSTLVGVNFSPPLPRSWQYRIAPAGTRAWVVVASGSGGQPFHTRWDTAPFRNGVYDTDLSYVRGSVTRDTCVFGDLQISNLPTAPAPVVVSPPRNSQDVFDASWGTSTAGDGIDFYEYAIDCKVRQVVQTPSQGVRLIGQAQPSGLGHFLCVRGVDRFGTRGPWATSGYFTYVLPSPPTAPYPVRVSPASNTLDVFDVSWGASSSSVGVYYYEYDVDCDGSRVLQTTSTGVRMFGEAVTRGTHRICVRAVDLSGLKSAPASAVFSYAFITPALSLSAPSTAIAGSRITVSAVVTDGSGRPARAKLLYFGSSWGALGYAYTDSFGRASVPLYVTTTPANYEIFVIALVIASDRTYAYGSASRRITVVRAADTRPPSVPSVSVTPAVSTTNAFTARWPTSTDDVSGVERYEYRMNGGVPITVRSTIASIAAPSLGSHTIEVRAIDRVGNASDWSGPPTRFEWRRATTAVAITGLPSSVQRCSSVDFSARLTSEGTAVAGRAVSLRIDGTGATAMTNASGIASASIRFEGAPGRYTATATYAGDTVLPGSQATATIQVTGDASASCRPTGGGPGPGGGGPPPGNGGPGGGQGQGGSGQGGLSVDIPPR